MPVLKCKMCGGSLDIPAETSFGECPYCGTVTTFPSAADEERAELYNLAEQYRQTNNFDRAQECFLELIRKNSADGEAYWGALLAKYGIEYVVDPATQKRIPTCHRVQSDPIQSDPLYVAALQNAADKTVRSLYVEQAGMIAGIQQEILNISAKEEPYDIFICYKESEEDGSRTRDSVLAQELCEQLTDRGYKIFFARISLEGKLGSAYEPIIFAALNSAKVMLVIGTSAEHFQAVWVRNEWSRFLAFMKTRKDKVLIPCYSGMDPYSLPDEMKMLQAQDMNKVGFQQDLIRGIQKVIDHRTLALNAAHNNTEVLDDEGIGSLESEIGLLLEDGNFPAAEELCNRILSARPDYARAYFCKMMCDLQVCREEDLLEITVPFSDNANYIKAICFADEELRKKLARYESRGIAVRHHWEKANELLQQKKNVPAAELLKRAGEYRNAAELAETYQEEVYNQAYQMRKRFRFLKSARLFHSLSDYNDAEAQAAESMQYVVAVCLWSMIGIFGFAVLLLIGAFFYFQANLNWPYQYRASQRLVRANPGFSSEKMKTLLDSVQASSRTWHDKIAIGEKLKQKWKTLWAAEKKAAAGDVPAMLQCAGFFSRDTDFRDSPAALHFYGQAAEKGDFNSLLLLFNGYSTGEPAGLFQEADRTKMFYWALRSGECGHPEIWQLIPKEILDAPSPEVWLFRGIALAKGISGKADQFLAYEYFRKAHEALHGRIPPEMMQMLRKAAEGNLSSAQLYIGKCCQLGVDGKPSPRDAAAWFRKAADQQHPIALYELAFCYQTGSGVMFNMAKASRLAEQAIIQMQPYVQNKNSTAYFLTAECQQLLRKKYSQKEILHNYELAAARNPNAQLKVGLAYLQGNGVRINMVKGLRFLYQAAAAGNLEAQYYAAMCMQRGYGMPKNERAAFRELKKIAKKNYYPAQLQVADYYRTRLSMTDMSEQEAMLEIASENGSVAVLDRKGNKTGMSFDISSGGTQIQKAVVRTWYLRAGQNAEEQARVGDPDAQYALALAIEYAAYKVMPNSVGMPDYAYAAQLLKRAARAGNVRAKFKLISYWVSEDYEKRHSVWKERDKFLKYLQEGLSQANGDEAWNAYQFLEKEKINADSLKKQYLIKAASQENHFAMKKIINITEGQVQLQWRLQYCKSLRKELMPYYFASDQELFTYCQTWRERQKRSNFSVSPESNRCTNLLADYRWEISRIAALCRDMKKMQELEKWRQYYQKISF